MRKIAFLCLSVFCYGLEGADALESCRIPESFRLGYVNEQNPKMVIIAVQKGTTAVDVLGKMLMHEEASCIDDGIEEKLVHCISSTPPEAIIDFLERISFDANPFDTGCARQAVWRLIEKSAHGSNDKVMKLAGERLQCLGPRGLPEAIRAAQSQLNSVGILWTKKYSPENDGTTLKEEKPMMCTATFIDPRSLGISDESVVQELEGKLLITCLHSFGPSRYSCKLPDRLRRENGFLEGIINGEAIKFNMYFSFTEHANVEDNYKNKGRFEEGGIPVKYAFVPEGYVISLEDNIPDEKKLRIYPDIVLCVLRDKVEGARQVEIKAVTPSTLGSGAVNGTWYGLGMGLRGDFPVVSNEEVAVDWEVPDSNPAPNTPKVSVRVRKISNSSKSALCSYDKKVKHTGWQTLKEKKQECSVLLQDVDFNLYTDCAKQKPGDSGSLVRDDAGKGYAIVSDTHSFYPITPGIVEHFSTQLVNQFRRTGTTTPATGVPSSGS